MKQILHYSAKAGMVAIAAMILTAGVSAQTQTRSSDNVLTSSTTQSVSGNTYTSTTSDQSAVKVTDSTLTISKCKLYNSADASSTDDASFYGTNAVMLSYGKSTSPVITSSNNYVSGTGKGANGIFAYGNGTITTTGDTIYQTGGNARAIMASGGGTITVNNDIATTTNGSSSVIATDRGGGTITVNGGTYTANGSNSAGIYSTGTITANNATFVSNGGEMYVIEGSNNITVNNCTATSNKDKWGILLYQSFSGDAEGSTGTITLKGGTLTYNGTSGGLFYNTNATANINLEGVTIVNKCDTLVRSLKGGWGNNATASSGGTTYINATGQTMEGMIYADSNSKDYITLSSSSTYKNASLNPGNVAGLVTLTMDESSTLSLAADCHINGAISISGLTSGSTVSNILGNGHNIYYTKSTNTSLNGETYSLTNGGYLCPEGTIITANEIVSELNAPAAVTIYNLMGQVVYQTSSGNSSVVLNQELLNNLSVPQGFYIVRTNTGSVVSTVKMIKR